MTNKVKITMKNVPAGLDSMYVTLEETAISQGVRNVLFSGVKPVNGNVVEIDIGNAGTVGAGVIVSANNFTTAGAPFKAMSAYSVIEAGLSSKLLSGEYLSVICTGDSMADLGSLENEFIYSLNTKGWPANTFAQSSQLFNMLPDSGIAGNTTQMLLERLQTDIIDTGAQVALIMVGTNDVHAQISEEVTIANMQTIVNQLVSSGMKVILTPITWRGDNHPIYTDKIELINSAYADIANANPNVAISSSFDEFNALAVNQDRWGEVTIDKLHTNSAGAYLVGKVLSKALDENLSSDLPASMTQLLINSELTGSGGTTGLGATGQAPDSFVVFYAQPSSGLGVEYVGDSLLLRAGDGATGGRVDVKLFQNAAVNNPSPTDSFIVKATVSIDKQMLNEIESMAVTLKPNTGKSANFLFNGESLTAVFKENFTKFVMRTLPTSIDPSVTSIEAALTLKSRGNQDVEIKVYDLQLIKI